MVHLLRFQAHALEVVPQHARRAARAQRHRQEVRLAHSQQLLLHDD
jgi:hypothetical protein